MVAVEHNSRPDHIKLAFLDPQDSGGIGDLEQGGRTMFIIKKTCCFKKSFQLKMRESKVFIICIGEMGEDGD